jgi:polar amino acid transport system permease protein
MNPFQFWPDLLQGIQYTILITAVSFTIGAVIAVFVTAARRSALAPLRWLGTAYVEVLRGIPPLPWLFLGFFALPMLGITLDPVEAGIAVFSLIAGAYLTEVYRSGFRAVPPGQIEASQALGLKRFQMYSKVLVPQALRAILPGSVAYLIGLLKDSALVSVIGVHDITAIALVENRQSGAGLAVFISAAALYLLMSIPIGVFGRWLGERMKKSQPGGHRKSALEKSNKKVAA